MKLSISFLAGLCSTPSDYEPCSICGYDHEYEYDHAHREHIRIGNNQFHPEHKNEMFYRKEYGIVLKR